MIAYRQALPVGLLATLVALGGVVALEVLGWERDVPASVGASPLSVPTSDRRPETFGTSNRQASWLNEILSRPLFSPNRRPAEVGASRGLPRLTGIVVAGSQKIAIFAGSSSEHPIIAQAGTHLGAYDVQTITDNGVTVVGPEGVISIRPVFDANRPAAGAQPAVRVPAPAAAPVAAAAARPAAR